MHRLGGYHWFSWCERFLYLWTIIATWCCQKDANQSYCLIKFYEYEDISVKCMVHTLVDVLNSSITLWFCVNILGYTNSYHFIGVFIFMCYICHSILSQPFIWLLSNVFVWLSMLSVMLNWTDYITGATLDAWTRVNASSRMVAVRSGG